MTRNARPRTKGHAVGIHAGAPPGGPTHGGGDPALTQLRTQSTAIAEAIDPAQDFTQLVRQRQPAQLDPWLKRATNSTLEALRRFAAGLSEDYQVVKAGGTLPWSTGPVEGHINRLKMLKRQMFGRARLDLLGHRFLRTPREREAQGVGPRTPGQAPAAAQDA